MEVQKPDAFESDQENARKDANRELDESWRPLPPKDLGNEQDGFIFPAALDHDIDDRIFQFFMTKFIFVGGVKR